MDIKALIAKVKANSNIKEVILKKYLYLKNSNFNAVFDKVAEEFEIARKYFLALKRNFFCQICDYKFHKAFRIQKAQIEMD